jgi:hypothetical protein
MPNCQQRITHLHPNIYLIADIGASTPVVCFAIRLSQSKKTFSELKCRRSINKADKVFIPKLSTASYLTLRQLVCTIGDAARELEVTESSLS